MFDRISEKDLILPALFCIDRSPAISTTELTTQLRELLNPQGEDVQILSGRMDDKFSQKVRNLRSHKTLEKYDLVIYERQGNQGYWSITATGKEYLEANRPLLAYLGEQRFDYSFQQEALAKIADPSSGKSKPILVFDEKILEDEPFIVEGSQNTVIQKAYIRSAKLRNFAIQYYALDGVITCKACGFNFEEVYGDLGKNFIEIHHIKPIFNYSEDDLEKTLQSALQNVVPLCSNCHRMIHRKRNRMLSVKELQIIIHNHRR